MGTPEYRGHFEPVYMGPDSIYNRLVNMLAGTKEYHSVYAVYIGMYDEENSRIIYICDAEQFDDLTMLCLEYMK